MTTNHDRCPAGHTFIGPDSWLRQTWLAAHMGHIGAETWLWSHGTPEPPRETTPAVPGPQNGETL